MSKCVKCKSPVEETDSPFRESRYVCKKCTPEEGPAGDTIVVDRK